MARLNDAQKALRLTALNTHVPPQAAVGGRAVVRPSGERKVRSGEIYGERVFHEATDRIVRYIVVRNGEDVDEYNEEDGWYHYTMTQARGF